jgi:preprotein translocase subunit SecD
VQGFALVYGIGILVSLFTAIILTRTMLLAFGNFGGSKVMRQFFGAGISKV